MTHRTTLLGAALAAVVWAGAAEAQTITCNYLGDRHYVRIDEPDVKQARWELSAPGTAIVVYAGDQVWVRAGGCVQTGGRGLTWKRYVNPSGPNSSRLYHGRIQIPGAVEDLTNLSSLVGGDGAWSRAFAVGVGDPNFFPGVISLGYSDDAYGDNGYWGHDDGTQGQCAGSRNAWVELYVVRADGLTPVCQ